MSSGEFKSTYKHAAALVRARLSSKTGIRELLIELEKRIPDEKLDPRYHRELFFEPRIDAQLIKVPIETAESAAELLHKFGVFRLWVRVNCPDVEEHEVGTILETDDPDDFELLTSKSCDHCGRHHDLDWEDCETVYAINTRLNNDQKEFDFSRLKSKAKNRPQTTAKIAITDQSRCEVLSEQDRPETTPRGLLIVALRSNHEVQDVPSPLSVWLSAWAGPTIILFSYLLSIIPVARFAGERLAWGMSVLVLVIIFLVIRGQVQTKLAPTAVQRQAMYWGFPIAAICLSAGVTGFHLKAAAGEGEPWWTRLDYGETSPLLIWAGVVLFLLTLLFVWGYDFSRGWFERKTGQSE